MASLSFLPKPIGELPWRMLLLVIAIAAFSSVVLYSAAGGRLTWALPQAVRFGVFFCMAIGLSRLRPETFKMAAFPAYVIVLLMLLFVEALGFVSGGAQRWLNLGIINLQPSELMKVCIILATASFYSMLPAREIRGWSSPTSAPP
jgi:rod shape determining protein RodA